MNSDDAHATTHLRSLAETTPDVLLTIDAESEIQYVSPAVEETFGYSPDELVGESLATLMPEALAERHRAAVHRYLRTGTRRLEWDGVELTGERADGTELPLEISFSEFEAGGERHFAGVLRDVSGRRRRVDQIQQLNDRWGELAEAETFEDASESAVEAADEILDLPLTTVERYDAETGRLETCARTDGVAALVGDGELFPGDRGAPWEAFAENRLRVWDDLGEDDGATEGTPGDADREPNAPPIRGAIVAPAGGHGVVVSVSRTANAFSETTIALAETLAGNLASTFDRLDRESALRERSAELEEKNARLTRLQRVNREIRETTQALLDAESSAEVKQLVCDGLAGSDHYRFVWFGDVDPATDEIVPIAWAGVEDGYLDAITVTADRSETGQGPGGRAVRERTSQVQNDLQADPPFEPWRREAVERGYRASIAVPVVYGGTLYGLVNLYANEPGVFSEMEVDVLGQLGEMVGYALNALERYDALVAEDAVELEFAVSDDDDPLLSYLCEHEASFGIESVGRRHDGLLDVVAAVRGLSFEEITEFVGRYAGTDDPTFLRERGDEIVVEIPLTSTSTTVALLERGARPTGVRGTPGEARFTIRLPQSAPVRRFVDLLDGRYDEVELVARRTTSEPVTTRGEFERAYLDALTDRQLEVLRTAYFAGYFEQPRASSASDVADALDVSQPTVSRQVRAGERALFSMLFEEGSGA